MGALRSSVPAVARSSALPPDRTKPAHRGRSRWLGRLLSILVLVAAVVVPPVELSAPTLAALAANPPQPGTFTGMGFDACTAPSSATMQAWLSNSPYRAVGIYFGGLNRGCSQPNLTPTWVAEQISKGWHLMPLYVGLQAPCTTATNSDLIDPNNAAAQGRSEGEDAANQALALGLTPGSILINDMEAYAIGNAACTAAVLKYMDAWTVRLHERGYFSGFYSSVNSGVKDQVDAYSTPGYAHPDYVDFARWDGIATTQDVGLPADVWPGKQRIKQYRGGHTETYGSVTINIDNDYLDVAPLQTTPFGDLDGNGWPDLLTFDAASHTLRLYAGNGSGFAAPVVSTISPRAQLVDRHGDFDLDGREDVFLLDSISGALSACDWAGAALDSCTAVNVATTQVCKLTPEGMICKTVGTNWTYYREITAVGDMNHDGRPDLLAVQQSTGILYFFPGSATGVGTPVSLGSGWNALDELVGIGDADHDGNVDIYARLTATGELYFYPGRGVGFGSRVRAGTGWSGLHTLTAIGDFDRDGYSDLFATETATGKLYRYPAKGAVLGPRVAIMLP
jgi:Rv2525c-like, glycoside hydrolase-like domain/FG-GAP-like repeat